MKESPKESMAEFTARAVIMGVVLGVVFGAANAYTGARFGMTVCASIPAAVMTVAFFRLFRARCTILEANMSQTIGSASTAMATGAIFTLPALFMWKAVPPYWQIVALCFLGGMLGIAAMIPLRRLLIVEQKDELPYPEGTACAEVLQTTTSENASGGNWIFWGILVGAGVKLLISMFFVIPLEIGAYLPVLPKAWAAMEIAPLAIGVGYILGYRQSAIILAGSAVAWFVLIPMIATFGAGLQAPFPPETQKLISAMDEYDIWGRYVRYMGAGAVAVAGVVSIANNLPMMLRSFASVARGLRRGAGAGDAQVERTQQDLPPWVIVAVLAGVVLAAWLVPGLFGGAMGFGQRFVCAVGVAVLGVFFVTVASRIVGLVGVTSQPTSAIALLSITSIALVFVWCGWMTPEARIAVLTVGTVVCIAASKAGDISQDLKTGFLVGATPRRQQVGQMIGAAVACWFVAATVLLLGHTYEYGSKELGVPQATLMKTIIEGVLAGQLPWNLIMTGAGVGVGAMLCGASGLAFGIGLYLPLAAMAPIFVGGVVRRLVDRARKGGAASLGETEANPGVLAASGLVAGEALAGVVVAGMVAAQWLPKKRDVLLAGGYGQAAGVTVVLAVCVFLFVAGRRRTSR